MKSQMQIYYDKEGDFSKGYMVFDHTSKQSQARETAKKENTKS